MNNGHNITKVIKMYSQNIIIKNIKERNPKNGNAHARIYKIVFML